MLLGMSLAAQGEFNQAIAASQRATELNPTKRPGSVSAGPLSARFRPSGNWPSPHLGAAAEIDPNNAECLWQTAWILATGPEKSVRSGSTGGGVSPAGGGTDQR